MDESELKQRTKRFALRSMKLVDALPKTTAGRVIGNQLVRSATSVGANYRAACRGRSKAEYIAKIGVVEEEADESGYWMELLVEGGLIKTDLVSLLLNEADQLVAIMASSRKSAALNRKSAIGDRK